MSEHQYEVVARRVFDVPRERIWPLVSDTHRWNRAMGLGAVTYAWRDVDGETRQVGEASELGQRVQWFEPPYQWIENRFMSATRTFISGPVSSIGLHVELRDHPRGCECLTRSYMVPKDALARLAAPLIMRSKRRPLETFLDTVAKRVTNASSTYDAHADGPRTATNTLALDERAENLRRLGADAHVVARLLQHLREAPDDDVTQMRPFEMAARFDMERRNALALFLRAARAGLVDLHWQINCPVCRVAARVTGSLADVSRKSHCAACNIDYETDFASQVEAVFSANASVRNVVPQIFCASTPTLRPHVFAELTIAPQQTVTHHANIPEGELRVRALRGGRHCDVKVNGSGSLSVTIANDGLSATFTPGDASHIEIQSQASAATTLLIEQRGWQAPMASGALITTLPEFHDLFASEAPATGTDLFVSHVVLLFSDLTGSTALYERTGDARAYAVVDEHFDIARDVLFENNGAIIKTMGDAVMASFNSIEDATRAAIGIITETRNKHSKLGVGVKVGIHAGPCLAVRANDRLDYFGTTVNVAARLQAQARAGEIVVSAENATRPQMSEILEAFERRDFTAALKGIRDQQSLCGFAVISGDGVATSLFPSN